MEIKILVIYVGVMGIRSEDIDTFVNKVSKKIIPETFQGEIIIIPVQSLDTKIECINPKYITESELIRENTELIKELQNNLKYQAELLKQKKYE